MPKLLTERFAMNRVRVDRSGPRPVIRDVLLCGATSANRRRYLKSAFEGERIKRYANVPVFLNHAEGRGGRKYEDRIAKVINPRHRADGMPVGDLEVRPKHPYAETFLDDAEHDPKSCGMSHVAQCEAVTGRDGWENVTEVAKVESVDIVLDPATVAGLFESTKRKGKTMRLSKFLERRVLFAKAATPAMREAAAVAAGEAPDADVDVADPSYMPDMDQDAVNDALKTGYQAALAAVISNALDKPPKEVARRIEKLVAAYQAATKKNGSASESRKVGWHDDPEPEGWQDVPTDAASFAASIRTGPKPTAVKEKHVNWSDDTPTTASEGRVGWSDDIPTDAASFVRSIRD